MQSQYDYIMCDTPRYIGYLGGYRSGKTFADCMKAIRLSSMNVGFNGLVTAPTATQISTIIIPKMEELLQAAGFKEGGKSGDLSYEYYASGDTRFILHWPTGDDIIYLRASENWKRIVGFDIAWFIADEFDTSGFQTCQMAWSKMVGRLTAGNIMQGCVSSTKEGFQWCYKFFEEGKYKPDRKTFECYVRNNKFIEPGYIEDKRQQLTEKQFRAFVNNEWINMAEGNVYDSYDREKNRTTETLKSNPNAPLSIGIDFNVGKMATVIGIVINGKMHIVSELYGSRNTEHLIQLLAPIVANRPPSKVFIDASGATEQTNFEAFSRTDKEQLVAKFGLDNVHHYKGHIPILDRVGAVNAKFKNAAGQRGLFINDKECPGLVRCIETQGFVGGKPDKSDDIDHYPDALGYMISYIWAPQRRAATITPLN